MIEITSTDSKKGHPKCCGNHFGIIEDGKNGYTFDPDNHEEVKDAFEKLLERRKEW